MLSLRFLSRAFPWSCLITTIAAVDPAAVYDGGFTEESSILLRIGNGGAGQSGLVKGIFAISLVGIIGPD